MMNIHARTTHRLGNNFLIKRLHITLLEVLIVIALLALFTGVISIAIRKAVIDQRFRNEVSLVVDQLRLAQDLMLILGTDVHLKFTANETKEGIQLELISDTRLPEHVQIILKKNRPVLKTIHGVFFDDETEQSHNKGTLDFLFLSKGAVMSRGMMRLSLTDRDPPPENELQNYICLRGYPGPISAHETYELAAEGCNTEKEIEYDKKLTQDTLNKIPDEMKKPQQETPNEPEEKERSKEETKPAEQKKDVKQTVKK